MMQNSQLIWLLLFFLVACTEKKPQASESQNLDPSLEPGPLSSEGSEEPKLAFSKDSVFTSQAQMQRIFKADIDPNYQVRHQQIGEGFINASYFSNQEIRAEAQLYVRVNLHSCQKRPCQSLDDRGRKQHLDFESYSFSPEQKNSPHFQFTGEEIEIAGKKCSRYYQYHWFEPKTDLDTLKNKKNEVVLYYHNQKNALEVTAFPQLNRNLGAEDWRQLISEKDLKKAAEKFFRHYIQYF